MWGFLLAASKLAWSQKAVLLPIISKWRALSAGGNAPALDPAAVAATIERWEPLAYEIATHVIKGGLSIRAAIIKVAVERLGLHKMTFEEEQGHMNRRGSDTG